MNFFRKPRENKPPAFDLLWACSQPDAHALCAEARGRSLVCFDGKQNAWIVLGYDAVVAGLKDVERLGNDPVSEFDPFVVGSDPPEHSKYRRLLQECVRHFDKASVVGFVERWMDGFLARTPPGLAFDAVGDLASPLSDSLAGAILGLDEGETKHLSSLRPDNRTDLMESRPRITAFLERLVATTDRNNRGGVFGKLLSLSGSDALSDQEIAGLLRLVWLAGTSTSTLFLPSLLLLMLRHPAAVALVRGERTLVPAFVSEALRLEGSVTFVHRRAKTSFELCGREIRRNDLVLLCLLAANSDPTAFPCPEMVDISRPASRHVAFGFGIHHCLGGYIARAVAETVVTRVLDSSPCIVAAQPLTGLTYEEGDLRGLKRLLLTVS